MDRRFYSESQQTLAALLSGPEGEEVRKKLHDIHRTALWRYATARRRPDPKATRIISDATSGRVAADGWLTAEEKVEIAAGATGTDGS